MFSTLTLPMMLAGAGHATFALAAIAALTLSPPASGHMTLVAMNGDAQRLAAMAIDAGALPVARGRLPASMVVDGRHDALAQAFDGHAVLILAAPETICGIPKDLR